jgi:serine protease Do
VRRFKYILSILIMLAVIVTVTGCQLPGLDFSSRNTQTTSPETTTPAATAAVATPTSTPSPINSTFSVPTSTSSVTSDYLPNFASVIKLVRPSVVAINTKVTSQSIFGGTYTQEGAGSGWIIDSSGLIVTNNHVVEGTSDITVSLEDGRTFAADTVRTDSVSDLAMIQIKADNLPPALKIGDSSAIQVGDWVVAIGNSLGQGISATKGIVSAKNVSVAADNGETLYDLLQTDAAINPGNSGGPLVNLAGEVIGINSIKVSQVGVEGMGYAISSQVAVPIINTLVKNGYVSRPWLGVSLYTVDQYAVGQLDLAVDKGVLLRQVVVGGPADKAGLDRYDVITNFDGQDVATVEDLVQAIRAHQVGQTVQVTYWRGSNQSTATITLEESPPPSTP